MSRPATFPQSLVKRAKLQFPQDVAKVEVLGHPNNMALSVGKMLGQKEVIDWMESVNAAASVNPNEPNVSIHDDDNEDE